MTDIDDVTEPFICPWCGGEMSWAERYADGCCYECADDVPDAARAAKVELHWVHLEDASTRWYTGWRSVCRCGWTSQACLNVDSAVDLGTAHTRESAR